MMGESPPLKTLEILGVPAAGMEVDMEADMEEAASLGERHQWGLTRVS